MLDHLFRHWFDDDWKQRDDIDDLRARQRRDRRKDRKERIDQRRRIEALEEECYELSLVTEALARLLIEDGALGRERLQAMMETIQTRRDAEVEAEAEREAERIEAPTPSRRRK